MRCCVFWGEGQLRASPSAFWEEMWEVWLAGGNGSESIENSGRSGRPESKETIGSTELLGTQTQIPGVLISGNESSLPAHGLQIGVLCDGGYFGSLRSCELES